MKNTGAGFDDPAFLLSLLFNSLQGKNPVFLKQIALPAVMMMKKQVRFLQACKHQYINTHHRIKNIYT